MKSNYEATGLIVSLWCWSAVNAPDGNLGGYNSRDISEAIGYKKAPAKLLDVLTDAGFVDVQENGNMVIHDWDEHAALLMDSNEQQKRNTRERVRRYRERRKANSETDESKQSNVTGNGCNAPTLPNLTLPNLTNDLYRGSSHASANYDRIKEITNKLFERYVGRLPTDLDCDLVYNRVVFGGQINEDAVGLLEYAFEAAHKAGKTGNWNYITAVLDRCSLNNIFTADEARRADKERADEI
jgi:hypothetical protein